MPSFSTILELTSQLGFYRLTTFLILECPSFKVAAIKAILVLLFLVLLILTWDIYLLLRKTLIEFSSQ